MGGSSSPAPAPPPAAPSASETSAQAIQSQIDALPKQLQAQQQYGPQFSQLNLDQLNQFGPGYAQAALDLQKQFGPQYDALQKQLNPELAGAQSTLANFLNSTDQQEYDQLAPGILQDTRAAQSQRGLGAISPLGSIDESVQLQRLKQNLKDRRLNIALSTAGRVPIGQAQQVQGTTGTGQLVQNVSPSDIFGYQQGLNNFNASIYSTQGSIYGNQLQQQGNVGGAILGSLAGGVGGGIGTGIGYKMLGGLAMCWVAAEVFGGWDDSRTQAARLYVTFGSPKWFVNLYARYGERVAAFIHDKPMLKAMFKPLFTYFAKKGGA